MRTVTTSGYLPRWIGSNTANTNPGDGAGFIFEQDYLNPKCPHAVSNWLVYINGERIHDTTLRIECVVQCGGDISGESGVVETSGNKTCKWLMVVPDGFGIQISFGSFDVSKLRSTVPM